MQHHEFENLDGLGLSALLRAGEVSPHALMACATALARQRAPALNALCVVQQEEALELARHWRLRGPFGGVPFLLKDTALACTRLPSTLGSRLFDEIRHTRNATLFERFEDAGFIAFGRTSVPELCMAPTTEARHNGGPTRNPWDLTRSAGGSSGGAAAAVAARIVPLAHGSDGAGSIRIPAACCGVFGMKASRGLVPTGPLRGEGWGGLSVDGVLSRTVRDTAAALDAVTGREPGAPYAAPVFAQTFQASLDEGLRRPLRVGIWRAPFAGLELAPPCRAGLEATAALCAALGHDVVELPTPDFDYEGFLQAQAQVLAANIVLSVDNRLRVLGRSLHDDDLEPALRDGYALGQSVPAAAYAAAIQRFHAIGRFMDACLDGVDVLMTPTLLRLPAPLGELATTGGFQDFRQRMGRYSCFLAVVNASGQPAASLPTYWTADRLPVGTQIIARHGRDDLVLQLAAQIEASGMWQPHQHRTPS